jgi:cytochrome P450
MARIRAADAAAIGVFVDEVLRLEGSVHFRPRRAAADAEVAGQAIAEGDMLLVILLAANRDPKRYGCPHEVDLERESPRDHISFNYGPRACPGAALARSELAEAITAGLARWPDLRLDDEAQPPGYSGFLMRSHRPLNVRVDAG